MKKLLLSFVMVLSAIFAKAQIDTETSNNTLAGADNLPLCTLDSASILNSSDIDCFIIHVNQGGVLIATISNPNPSLQIKITGVDSLHIASNMGVVTASVAGFGTSAKFVVCTGTYYIKIQKQAATTYPANYKLNVCLDTFDAFECNNSLLTASIIPNDTCFFARIQGVHANGGTTYVNQNDYDFYQMSVPRSGVINVNINQVLDINQRFVIEAYDNINNTILRYSRTASAGGAPVGIKLLVPNAGTYFIKVYEYSHSINPSDPYTLSDSTYHFCCSFDTTDLFELNNASNAAALIPNDTCFLARIQGIYQNDPVNYQIENDVDFYKYHIPRSGIMKITIDQVLDPQQRFVIEAYDSLTNVQHATTTAPANGANAGPLNVLFPSAGTYYLKVYEYSHSINPSDPYILSDSTYHFCCSFDTTELCEYNNIQTLPCSVTLGSCLDAKIQGVYQNYLTAPNLDVDWYELNLPVNDSVKVVITNAPLNQRFVIECWQTGGSNYIYQTTATGNGANVTLGCLLLNAGTYQFKIYEYSHSINPSDPYTLSDSTYHICFQSCNTTGVNEYSNNNLTIYPNPVTSNLVIQLNEMSKEPFTLSVLDLPGKYIYQQKFSNQAIVSIDVKDLPRGIYFVQFANERGIITKKFIKE